MYGLRVPSRRRFLAQGLMAAAAPALLKAERERPEASFGAMVGDVSGGEAVIWSRADRPARMVVEYATNEAMGDARRVVGPAALEVGDFTARVLLTGLPPGQRIFHQVSFQDLRDLSSWSRPVLGSFRTPPDTRRDVSFAWSADTAGQGWGINHEWGGFKLCEAIRATAPDFFVHCGDVIYADNPLAPEVTLDDGSIWRNLVTPAKAKVAETLDEFRGNYQYNLLDDNLRRLCAEVPQVFLWDDHEVVNNWDTTGILDDARYSEKSVALLAARGRRAFLEYCPLRPTPDGERIYRSLSYGPSLELFVVDLRSHRGPNGPRPEPPLWGAEQLEWLKQRLRASAATWKVIVHGMPLGLLIPDVYDDPKRGFESIATGDGPPAGRELEVAQLLSFLQRERVRNVVWITGDVHYAAAHHYDPRRARFTRFDPFWEFVAGPINAGTFGPNPLDDTFGPEVRFLSIPKGTKPNRPPSEGLQFFGTARVDGRTETLTVRLHDLTGRSLFSVDLEPRR
jgi:alkaline phosphatase D